MSKHTVLDVDNPHAPAALEASSVVIAGAGLAGLAAAVRLAQRGVAVTVVETSKGMGGRAGSFTDPGSGDTLDLGQHVLLRACTNLIDFYERLGVEGHIQWHKELYFAARDEETDERFVDTLRAEDLPAPLHLARPLWRMRSLSLGEKWAISRGILAILQTSPAARSYFAKETFAQWLDERRQPAGAVDKFWRPIIVSACNERLDRVSASYALQTFQEGFLRSDAAYEMGVADVPLARLLAPAAGVIERAGGRVLTGRSVEAIDYDGRRVTGLTLDGGERLDAEATLVALPPDRVAKVASDRLRRADERLRHLDEFDTSPIVNVHLFYRKSEGGGEGSGGGGEGGGAVMDPPHLILTRGPVQWVFNRGRVHGDVGEGGVGEGGNGEGGEGVTAGSQHLLCVASAAYDLVEESADVIVERVAGAVGRWLPGVAGAELVHHRVVKERHATFAPRPGVEAMRPAAGGSVEGLVLAGDWCATGWPATMEGAVRSGYLAAEAALAELGLPAEHSLLAEDLDAGPLYRLMSA